MNLKSALVFGSIMMSMLTILVYGTIGDSKAFCTQNPLKEKLDLCLNTMNLMKLIITFSWLPYISGFVYLLIGIFKKKYRTDKNNYPRNIGGLN